MQVLLLWMTRKAILHAGGSQATNSHLILAVRRASSSLLPVPKSGQENRNYRISLKSRICCAINPALRRTSEPASGFGNNLRTVHRVAHFSVVRLSIFTERFDEVNP
jgi:hypothetical protein